MTILPWEDFIERDEEKKTPVAMTIGVFDGVHRGHMALITRVLECPDARPWILTFRTNPILSLNSESHRGDLMSLDQKLEIFARLGVQGVLIVDFSGDFRRLKGEEFLSRIVAHSNLSYLAVGEDFHCGYGMDTDAEKTRAFLGKTGTSVEIIPPVFYKGERISSTRIRDFVMAGTFSPAEEMLGRPYRVELPRGPRPGGAGIWSLEKRAFAQVLPRRGRFPVLFEDPGMGPENGAVDIDERYISWHYDGEVKAIIFVS